MTFGRLYQWRWHKSSGTYWYALQETDPSCPMQWKESHLSKETVGEGYFGLS
jgi:hypothetical protein